MKGHPMSTPSEREKSREAVNTFKELSCVVRTTNLLDEGWEAGGDVETLGQIHGVAKAYQRVVPDLYRANPCCRHGGSWRVRPVCERDVLHVREMAQS
jgi:hypothetical protein